MKRRKITWSPTAIRHFSSWIQYVAQHSIKSAEKERVKLLKSVSQLQAFPESGRMVPEFGNPNLREIIQKPIRIIYSLKSKEIRLLAFHHSKMQLDISLFNS